MLKLVEWYTTVYVITFWWSNLQYLKDQITQSLSIRPMWMWLIVTNTQTDTSSFSKMTLRKMALSLRALGMMTHSKGAVSTQHLG